MANVATQGTCCWWACRRNSSDQRPVESGRRRTLATIHERRGVRVADISAALGNAGTRVTEEHHVRGEERTVVRLHGVEEALRRRTRNRGDSRDRSDSIIH